MTDTGGGSERSATAVEVEFTIDDATYPFVSASERASGPVELVEMVPRADDRYAEFFTVPGIEADDVLGVAGEFEDLTATCLTEHEDGGLYEFVVSDNCPARRLATLGAIPRQVRGVDGNGRVVAMVPPGYDAAAVVEQFLDAVPAADLVRKQARDSLQLPFSRATIDRVADGRLTDRQREVLETAYDAGYYDWPREASGADVAADLEITPATFSEHIQAAERKLIGFLLDDART